MFSHAYDPGGQEHDSAMGIYAGFCWLIGGLEASISLHVANNVILMLPSMVAGLDPFASEGVRTDALQGIALEGLYVGACPIFSTHRACRGEVSRNTAARLSITSQAGCSQPSYPNPPAPLHVGLTRLLLHTAWAIAHPVNTPRKR